MKIACDAIQAASRPHHFLGVHKSGQVAMIRTRGNPDCHIILRGGATPNYDEASVAAACAVLEGAGLAPSLMVDCSHANCSKEHERQLDVVREIARQVEAGSRRVFGAMIESHLHPGAQKFTAGRDDPAQARLRHQHHRSLPRLGRHREGAGHAGRRGPPAPGAGRVSSARCRACAGTG